MFNYPFNSDVLVDLSENEAKGRLAIYRVAERDGMEYPRYGYDPLRISLVIKEGKVLRSFRG